MLVPNYHCSFLFTWTTTTSIATKQKKERKQKKSRVARIVANNLHDNILKLMDKHGVAYRKLATVLMEASTSSAADGKEEEEEEEDKENMIGAESKSKSKPKSKRKPSLLDKLDVKQMEANGIRVSERLAVQAGRRRRRHAASSSSLNVWRRNEGEEGEGELEAGSSSRVKQVVVIEGKEACLAFHSFWLEHLELVMRPIKKVKLLPKLYSTTVFVHSSSGVTRVTKCQSAPDAKGVASHSLTLSGVVFPSQWRKLVQLLASLNDQLFVRCAFVDLQHDLNYAMHALERAGLSSDDVHERLFGEYCQDDVGVARLRYNRPLFRFYTC